MEKELTPGRPIRVYTNKNSYFDYSTDDFVAKKLNYFEGWKCGAGVESLQINMDGDIYVGSCWVGGKLGNIFSDFNLPEDWIQCTRKACPCGADIFIPKVKSEENKKFLVKTFNQTSMSLDNGSDVNSQDMVAIERTHTASLKQIFWEIGRRCNYDCSYCWPEVHNKTDRHKTLDELIAATDKILNVFAKNSKVSFVISGGEPTLNPDFVDWIKYINSRGHLISLHSNGSRLPNYYKDLIHLGDINLSAHFEFMNPDRFFDVVKTICAEKVRLENKNVGHLEVKLMLTNMNRKEVTSFQKRLLTIPFFNEFCTWAYVPLREGLHKEEIIPGYSPEDFKIFGNGIIPLFSVQWFKYYPINFYRKYLWVLLWPFHLVKKHFWKSKKPYYFSKYQVNKIIYRGLVPVYFGIKKGIGIAASHFWRTKYVYYWLNNAVQVSMGFGHRLVLKVFYFSKYQVNKIIYRGLVPVYFGIKKGIGIAIAQIWRFKLIYFWLHLWRLKYVYYWANTFVQQTWLAAFKSVSKVFYAIRYQFRTRVMKKKISR